MEETRESQNDADSVTDDVETDVGEAETLLYIKKGKY